MCQVAAACSKHSTYKNTLHSSATTTKCDDCSDKCIAGGHSCHAVGQPKDHESLPSWATDTLQLFESCPQGSTTPTFSGTLLSSCCLSCVPYLLQQACEVPSHGLLIGGLQV